MCTQLMKCAAGDIVPSLTRLKKHGSELKFFVSIFGKLNQINNIKSRKVAAFENCEIFSNYYFSHVRDYKATLSGGNKDVQVQFKVDCAVKYLSAVENNSMVKIRKKSCFFRP